MELLARFGSGGCPHDWTALEPWALWTWKARKGAARSGAVAWSEAIAVEED